MDDEIIKCTCDDMTIRNCICDVIHYEGDE